MGNVAGAILAGGKSSRMGKDKANLHFHGRTLLQHTECLLREAGMKKIYISRADAIPDLIPGYGPLSGVHAILNSVSPDVSHIVFISVDMPGIQSSHIKQLAYAPEELPLVRFDEYVLPFRMSMDTKQRDMIETILREKHNVSLRAFQQRVSPTSLHISTEEQACFSNINTPEEWQAFREKQTA